MPPPKKGAPATSKAPAKTGTGAKTTGKAPAKTTTGAKAPAKGAAAPPSKKEEAPAPKPVVIAEVPFKQIDAQVVWDKEGKVQASGKWALVMDENSLIARFLRHRDVNMLTVPDQADMQPEKIRLAVLGSLKYGKPLVIDMMESETFDFCADQFNAVLDGLMDLILDKKITEDANYMKLVKPEDGPDFQNQYDYNLTGFSFLAITSCMAPNESLLQRTYPVKVIN